MRPDCTLQQLARGYISFSHLLLISPGEEGGCNNPLKPPNTTHKPSPCFWTIKTLSCQPVPYKTQKNWPGGNVNETSQMRAQIFTEWQKHLFHMSNSILLVKMAWRKGSWSGSRVQCSLGKAGKVMRLKGLQSCCSSAWGCLWEGKGW